jgi:glycerophosphoryl diester phosphodiesterase
MLLTRSSLSTGLLAAARQRHLFVHAWTFRADDVPAPFAGATSELATYFRLGVDGVFVDHPDVALTAREAALPAGRCPNRR